jgi:hypothetical protein
MDRDEHKEYIEWGRMQLVDRWEAGFMERPIHRQLRQSTFGVP